MLQFPILSRFLLSSSSSSRYLLSRCQPHARNMNHLVSSTASSLSSSCRMFHVSGVPAAARQQVAISFTNPQGAVLHPEVSAVEGETLLDVCIVGDIDEIEGVCGGTKACSTCHMILPQSIYDALPPASEDEEDLLDLAKGATDTSRLGCQVRVTEAFEGVSIVIPDEFNNLMD